MVAIAHCQGAEIRIKPNERIRARNLGPHPYTMARIQSINVRQMPPSGPTPIRAPWFRSLGRTS